MTDNIEDRIRSLISSQEFVLEALNYMGEMLAADKAAHKGEYSDDGDELASLIDMWASLEGTKKLCNPNPKHEKVNKYYQDLFRQLVVYSDKLAEKYDPD